MRNGRPSLLAALKVARRRREPASPRTGRAGGASAATSASSAPAAPRRAAGSPGRGGRGGARRPSAGLGLAVADHQHRRGSCASRPRRSSCRSTRCARSTRARRSAASSALDHLLRVRQVAVGDRQHDGLRRRQPERELARVVLDQDADEALERAQHRAVDHHRPVLVVVGAGVGEVEALRQVEVELERAALPGAADGVGQVHVDLRAVEGAVALVDRVRQPAVVEHGRQRVPRPGPTPRRRPRGSRAASRAPAGTPCRTARTATWRSRGRARPPPRPGPWCRRCARRPA